MMLSVSSEPISTEYGSSCWVRKKRHQELNRAAMYPLIAAVVPSSTLLYLGSLENFMTFCQSEEHRRAAPKKAGLAVPPIQHTCFGRIRILSSVLHLNNAPIHGVSFSRLGYQKTASYNSVGNPDDDFFTAVKDRHLDPETVSGRRRRVNLFDGNEPTPSKTAAGSSHTCASPCFFSSFSRFPVCPTELFAVAGGRQTFSSGPDTGNSSRVVSSRHGPLT
ncbi:hypothetical protein QBC44DRAFT_360514 [Cladorrhinum sp. PSN332]|nr:hypothetical protein QBC44DRAFT_360514 [Cladorrhinum sp. PSN332]